MTSSYSAMRDNVRIEERVLVLAAAGEPDVIGPLAGLPDIDAVVCPDVDALCREVERGAGAVVLTSGRLRQVDVGPLEAVFGRQLAWSDLPVIAVCRAGEDTAAAWALDRLGNAAVLQRPLHAATLVSSLRAALRARRRQYEVRDQMVTYRRMNAALSESEARLRLALEAAGMGAWATNEGESAGIIDAGMQALFGLPGDATRMDREQFLRLVHEEDRGRVEEAIDAAWDSSGGFDTDFRVRLGGAVRWYAGRGRVIRGPDGRRRMVGVNYDITPFRHAHEALMASEQRFRAMADDLPLIVWLHDVVGGQTFVNKTFCEYFGVRREEMRAERWMALVHPNDAAAYLETFERSIAEQRPFNAEVRVRRADGAWRLLQSWGSPRFNDEGEFLGMVGTSADQTERRDAERALLESEQRFRSLVEETALATWEAGPDGRITSDSPSWRRLTGLTIEQWRDHAWLDAVHPDDTERLAADWRRVLARGEPSSNEFRVRTAEGRYIWVDVRAAPIRDAHGEIVKWVGMNTDIDHLKRTEEELRRLNQQLERRVEQRTVELERRAAQLSRLGSELSLAESRERERIAKILHDGLQQLIVGARLSLGSIDTDDASARREARRRVETYLQEAVDTSRSLAVEISPPVLKEQGLAAGFAWLAGWLSDRHGLKVELSIDPDANPERDDVRTLLFESVRELLFNVVKHAGVKSATLRLTSRGGSRLRVDIEDGGRGFDPDAVLDPSSNGSRGVGLISIRERLTLLGGEFRARSALGGGARFTLIAPRTRRIPLTSRRASLNGDAPRPAAASGRTRVLIADDHAVMREGLSVLLARRPEIEIVGVAEDGLEAVELAKELRPDVVIMDFAMADLDGPGATRRIVESLPDVRVVGLSLHGDARTAELMLNAGAEAHLNKNGDLDRLLEHLGGG